MSRGAVLQDFLSLRGNLSPSGHKIFQYMRKNYGLLRYAHNDAREIFTMKRDSKAQNISLPFAAQSKRRW